MAHSPRLTNDLANAMADALAALLDDGYLRIYDGTQPATADTAITTQTLLAELRFDSPAAPAASAGILTFNAITDDASANDTGTATWARMLQSDGTTAVMDGSVGESYSFDVTMGDTSIVATQTVSITSLQIAVPKA